MTTKHVPAQFIWTKESLPLTDRKVCFRKKTLKPADIKKLSIEIWADSRYYLWINGIFIETGPSRCWPAYPEKDCLTVDVSDCPQELCIAVLIWNFGISTSQYIHGNAGFYLSCTAADNLNNNFYIGTDTKWKCKQHLAFQTPVPRINVSQTWVEIYNDSLFPADWITSNFNDSEWNNAQPAVPPFPRKGEAYRLESMPKREIPLLTSVIKKPILVVQEKRILCRGIGIRIDYKGAFYPDDKTTEDILQTGYICCLINSPVRQKNIITLADRLWPEVDEHISLNGKQYTLKPGEREKECILEKGENLFLLDVSGARQRFTSDLHFFTETAIEFLPPIKDSSALFAALGPFEYARIGNIVCVDGFSVNIKQPDFVAAGKCASIEELKRFTKWLNPIDNILFDGAKLRSVGVKTESIHSIKRAYEKTLYFNASDKNGDHEVILDMGVEVSGFLSFFVEAEERVELDFLFFEHLANGNPEIPDDLDISLRYTCQEGKHFFRSLHRRGFRYIAIRTRSHGKTVISNLSLDERLYPLKQIASFHSNDGILNDIWHMCKRTVELCSEDVPADSPAFEQAFWIGDSYVMSLYYQWTFGETEMMKHALMLAARSMNYSALPDCHLPAGVHLLLTAWAQLWILTAKDYWQHTADEDFLKVLYPWLEKAAEGFKRHIDEHGLFTIHAWNMLDWADMDTPYRGTVTHLNALLVLCFQCLAELSVVRNLPDKQKKWEKAAAELAHNADIAFWNSERNCYIDSIHEDGTRSKTISVQSNLMMLRCDCVPEMKKKSIKSFVLSPPPDAVVPGSPFMAHFYYDFLFEEGFGKTAVAGIKKQWSPMLEHGSCWETFKGFYKDRLTRSYCHAWSSAPSYLFGAYILGIKPLLPGFAKIQIAPVPVSLKHAKGIVPIPAGNVYVEWRIKEQSFFCTITLPASIEYVFKAPEEYGTTTKLTVNFI